MFADTLLSRREGLRKHRYQPPVHPQAETKGTGTAATVT